MIATGKHIIAKLHARPQMIGGYAKYKLVSAGEDTQNLVSGDIVCAREVFANPLGNAFVIHCDHIVAYGKNDE